MPDRARQLTDAFIQHQRDVVAHASTVAAAVIDILDESEPDLRALVDDSISDLTGAGVDLGSGAVVARLDVLREDIRKLRGRYIQEVADHVDEQQRKFVLAEWAFVTSTYLTILDLTIQQPDKSVIDDLISTPFLGRDSQTWLDDLAASDANRIADAISIGLVQRKSKDAILRDVVGSRGLDGADGTTQVTRRQFPTLIDMMFVSLGTWARDAIFDENAELLPEDVYVAVLDSRTTPICRSLDGNIYPRGEGPMPPIHWGCRSMRVAVPKGFLT